MRLKAKAVISIVLFLCIGILSQAQNITIDYIGNLKGLFDVIQQKTDYTFSYNPSYLPLDSQITVKIQDEKVLKLVADVGARIYKVKNVGNHIVLTPINNKRKFQNTSNTNKVYTVRGYLINKATGQIITNASIYEHNNLLATTSNDSGYFTLKISAKNDYIPITVSKKNYYDTVIVIKPKIAPIKISLTPYPAEIIQHIPVQKLNNKPQSITDVGLTNFLVPNDLLALNNNIIYLENRPAQISFLPRISSNQNLSGIVSNTVSVNVLAGFNGAVEGFEIGGFANITKQYVNGFQAAGFGNVVGGSVSGLQVGGFFNWTIGSVNGWQIGGFQNYVASDLNGLQLAGFLNILNGKMNGVQTAGFLNYSAQSVEGIQLAGFGNICKSDISLAQVSGFFNIGQHVGGIQLAGFANFASKGVDGIQVAGFANISDSSVGGVQLAGFANFNAENNDGGQISGFMNISNVVKKVQLSGFLNVANKVYGSQIGIFNLASKVKGLQLGIFNISDTLNGISIGVFTYVRSGYHALSISSSQHLPINASLHTGVLKSYNIFSYSLNPNNYHAFGFGFGTKKAKGKKHNWMRTYELESFVLSNNQLINNELNNLTELRYHWGFMPTKNIEIFAGLNLSVHVRDLIEANNPTLIQNEPYSNITFNDAELAYWLAPKFGANLVF